MFLTEYFFAWLFICVTLGIAIAAEALSSMLFANDSKPLARMARLRLPITRLSSLYREKILLPDTAVTLLLYGPILAFAALLPVCAAIPFFTFTPILSNGADLLQIIQFFLLSDVLMVIVFYSLSSPASSLRARKQISNTVRLVMSVVLFFVMLAAYADVVGSVSDVFSISTLSSAIVSAASLPLYLGVVLFLFVIFSQLPHSEDCSVVLLDADELPEFRGLPRFLSEIWSLFRSFVIVALVVNIIFPTSSFTAGPAVKSVPWLSQIALFVSFWFTAIIMRVTVVPLCWKLYDKLTDYLPPVLSDKIVWILTAAASSMILIGIMVVSAENAAY